MKKTSLALSLLLAFFALPSHSADYDYTIVSAKSVDGALDSLKAAIQADDLKIPGVHNIPAPDDYVIVEVCDPKEVKTLLAAGLRLGLFLPCGKIAVYKDAADAGRTKISLLLPSVMTRIDPSKALAELARRLEPRLKKIVNTAR